MASTKLTTEQNDQGEAVIVLPNPPEDYFSNIPQLECKLLNMPTEYQGPEHKPVSLITPNAALIETVNQVEQCGRLMAATERPETIPESMPDGIKIAGGMAAPTQLHPTHVEYDLARFAMKARPSNDKRKEVCEAMANTLGITTPSYAAVPGNPMLTTYGFEQANDKALNLRDDSGDELFAHLKVARLPEGNKQ